MSDYRLDDYGRSIHKDLDALAIEITKHAVADNGRYPGTYAISVERFERLQRENAKFNGGSSVAAPIPITNFIWRGVPVVPSEP